MDWLHNIFFSHSIAQSMLVLSITIVIGILLGRIKIAGISLGITWIIFVGIAISHFGISVEKEVLHFVKEFGLILFVYSIGLQVGPGFFSSFKKGGMTLNILAAMMVILAVATTYIIHLVTGTNITTMVGIMSGAVTNTPGLGAAQQTFSDMTGTEDATIAMGYAVAYPLGVVGIIISILAFRYIFRIDMNKETEILNSSSDDTKEAVGVSVEIHNPAVFGKNIKEVKRLIGKNFIISRILSKENGFSMAMADSVINEGDKIFIITTKADKDLIISFIGKEIDMTRDQWLHLDKNLISRRILVTKSLVNGKSLIELKLGECFGVTITRINRAGLDLVASPHLKLQVGDKLTVVGSEDAVTNVSKVLGNSMKRLREPNLISIFVGIFIGVLFGSIPFIIPGIPQPVKLGLAGGPLVIAILISKFGAKYGMVTYTTMSANLMLREVGISLFLACVGLGAGAGFVDTIVNGGGAVWIGYGVLITIIPIIIIGLIGRLIYKINYFTLMGLIAGGNTDPPALAYSNTTAGNDAPAVSYATVYPLTMFLRVLMAQLLILIAA